MEAARDLNNLWSSTLNGGSGYIYDAPIVIGSPILPPVRRQPQDVPVIFVIITPTTPGTPGPTIVRTPTPVKAERLLASAFSLADTNRDSFTTAIDALLVINALNTVVPNRDGNIAPTSAPPLWDWT